MPNKMDNTKCDKHSEEIVEIRSNFENLKVDIFRQLKEIKEQLKPQFSSGEITTFLIALVLAMAGAMIYVSDVKGDGRVNTVQIENTIEQYKMINIKLDKLIDERK